MEKIKDAWDRTKILPSTLCGTIESTAASDFEAATRAEFRNALHQDGNDVSPEQAEEFDALVEIEGTNDELRTIEEIEQDLEGVSMETSSRADELDGEREVPTCDPAEALQKACELQRFVEKHSADLGEEAVDSADGLVNRIRRTPWVSGLKQARIDSMLSGTSSI